MLEDGICSIMLVSVKRILPLPSVRLETGLNDRDGVIDMPTSTPNVRLEVKGNSVVVNKSSPLPSVRVGTVTKVDDDGDGDG